MFEGMYLVAFVIYIGPKFWNLVDNIKKNLILENSIVIILREFFIKMNLHFNTSLFKNFSLIYNEIIEDLFRFHTQLI